MNNLANSTFCVDDDSDNSDADDDVSDMDVVDVVSDKDFSSQFLIAEDETMNEILFCTHNQGSSPNLKELSKAPRF